MKTQAEIKQIEQVQDRIYKHRALIVKVLDRALRKGFLKQKEWFSEVVNRLINGDIINKHQFAVVVDMAEKVGFPIPEDKKQDVWYSVSEYFEYRHFNQFGQELK